MPRSNPSNSYISSSGPVYTPQVSPSERDDDTSSVVSHRDYDHDYEARRFDQAPRDRLAGSDSGDAYTRRDLTPQKLVDREDDLRHEHRHHDRDVDRREERGLFRSREDRQRDEGRYDLATRPDGLQKSDPAWSDYDYVDHSRDYEAHHRDAYDDSYLRERYRNDARRSESSGDDYRDPRSGWLNDGMSRRNR